MLSRLKNLIKPDLKTLNTITISKQAILQNLDILQKLQPNSAFFPVLKSNAYGHGILQMLEILKGQKYPYLAVDSYPEYQLIHKHSDFHILLIWETLPENYRFFDTKRTAFAVYTLQALKALAHLKRKIRIHLFLNTWMNREWVQVQNLAQILDFLKENPHLELEGLMSHLHSADSDEDSVQNQVRTFKNIAHQVRKAGFSPQWKHIWASAGVFKIHDDEFTAFRPGLVLYGYSPFAKDSLSIPLKPALSLHSTIVSLQRLQAGEGVSYNQKWKADHSCRVATIPFGYYEWRLRKLSGKLSYRYQGAEFPQLGTICMNLSSCLANETMQIGDEIELISSRAWSKNSIENIAELAETIPYEILIRLDKGIRRIVVD